MIWNLLLALQLASLELGQDILKGTGNLLATEETRFVGIGCFELFVFLRVILASKLCKADALGSAKLGLAKVELDTLSPGKVTKGLASMCHPSHVPREDA